MQAKEVSYSELFERLLERERGYQLLEGESAWLLERERGYQLLEGESVWVQHKYLALRKHQMHACTLNWGGLLIHRYEKSLRGLTIMICNMC